MKRLLDYIGRILEQLITCSHNKGTKIVVSTMSGSYESIDTYDVYSIRLFKLSRLLQYGYTLHIFTLMFWKTLHYVFISPCGSLEERFGLIKWYVKQYFTVTYLNVTLFDPNDPYQCTYWTPYMNFN